MSSSPYPSSPTPSIRPSLSGTSKTARSDRFKLLSYNLSETIPYPPVFHITSVIVAFLALVIIALWAAATAGFEPYYVFDRDFNRTDDRHWYTPMLPNSVIERQRGKLCEPVIFNAGSTVQTNGMYRRLSYTIVRYNVPEDSEDPGAPAYSSVGYKGSMLGVCEVSQVSFIIDVRSTVVTFTAQVGCPTPWPAVLSTSYTFIPGVTHNGATRSPPFLNDLAMDLVYRVGKLFASPLYSKENTGGYKKINGTGRWSRLGGDLAGCRPRNGTHWCSIDNMILSNPEEITMGDTSSYSGSNYGNDPVIDQDIVVPFSNFISAFLSTVNSDLGKVVDNVFLNETSLHQYIHDSDTFVNSTIQLGEYDLHSAQMMLSRTIIDPYISNRTYSALTVANRSIATAFPCHITRSKGLASWLVSVIGLTFSIWGGLWQLYMLLVSYILSKGDNQRPRSNPTVLNVTTNPGSPILGPAIASKENVPLLPITRVVTGNSDLNRGGPA
ncbi:hypothetical protein I302_101125 [Kwoniella bestiolae CBS 10118]|uniref:Uncharacterized protein n=1 Tax=Kwoniella bestiolae CBS 10118 TaxID=1296100 RepID=A0A1B9G738_9TREE|nr:hypothetical protein I302_04501 [Kwoniella bestiolae CBS 10118]OCF26811.1 hypothetical protein I302_04501 [Kwoniella bestiolae CBS 10118]